MSRRSKADRKLAAAARNPLGVAAVVVCEACGKGRRGDGVRHAARWAKCKAGVQ